MFASSSQSCLWSRHSVFACNSGTVPVTLAAKGKGGACAPRLTSQTPMSLGLKASSSPPGTDMSQHSMAVAGFLARTKNSSERQQASHETCPHHRKGDTAQNLTWVRNWLDALGVDRLQMDRSAGCRRAACRGGAQQLLQHAHGRCEASCRSLLPCMGFNLKCQYPPQYFNILSESLPLTHCVARQDATGTMIHTAGKGLDRAATWQLHTTTRCTRTEGA